VIFRIRFLSVGIDGPAKMVTDCMNIDWVRRHCLSLPHTTETVQWGDNLVFKVAGKMYAVAALEPGDHWLSFKCSTDDFARLVEQTGIVPAPYLARANWVALETDDALTRSEIKRLLGQARDIVIAKLPKKSRAALGDKRRGGT
jgi:predicted DNA-binding protein (MmcQ/YjbR family)